MREEKEGGGSGGEGSGRDGSLPWRVCGERTVLHVHPGGLTPRLSAKAPSPHQGPILGLPCGPASSPIFATAFF